MSHALLFCAVLVGSAIPFVPTGEMVSGAAAFAVHSRLNDVVVFVLTWVASMLGDLLLLVEFRFGSRWVMPRIERSRLRERVTAAQAALRRNAFTAIISGRLIPGGRTPIIAALGLSRFSRRRFTAYNVVACGAWAAIYVTLGTVGSRVAHHPVWAMIIAITFAVSVGVGVQQLRRLYVWWRGRHQSDDEPVPVESRDRAE